MQNKNYKNINLSGFGEWGKTERNPSALLIQQLSPQQQHDFNIQSIKILKVTKEACDDYLSQINNKNAINIHLGLFDELQNFQLEMCAYNKLDYQLSDFNGCKIRRAKIDQEIDMDEQIKSSLNISQIIFQLQQLGYQVNKSYDPGRFLCNYLYYQSLKQNPKTIFLHVPLYETIKQEKQLQFLIDLIQTLHNTNNEQDIIKNN
ncbi:unnamed protein product [Paramecium pentaurelia]|uniref:Pyrrolidone-carboxylate peptidase n=1 Tax=Paramecium pentaurelia TaxID=43138 RepID=A0A8S1TF05_9CILI|nr:unnamed protein product [Paramecium pentaurelia]